MYYLNIFTKKILKLSYNLKFLTKNVEIKRKMIEYYTKFPITLLDEYAEYTYLLSLRVKT